MDAVRWLINKAVDLVKRAGNRLFGDGDEGEATADNPEHEAIAGEAESKILQLEAEHSSEGVSPDEAEQIAATVSNGDNEIRSISVSVEGDHWRYVISINPDFEVDGETSVGQLSLEDFGEAVVEVDVYHSEEGQDSNVGAYAFDAEGRLVEVRFTLTKVYEGMDRGIEAGAQKAMTGRKDGDDAGHALGFRFMGAIGDPVLLFAQNSNLNRGAYKKWENDLATAAKREDGIGIVVGNVLLTDYVEMADGWRPDTITVYHEIQSIPDGDVVAAMNEPKTFRNQAGETLPTKERVRTQDLEEALGG